MIGTLLFTVSGFYYTTISDLNSLTLKIEALESENRIQQKRLDLLDKKLIRMNKKLKGLNNVN